MCLTNRFSTLQEAKNHCPADEFYVYKVVAKKGDGLVSPHYSYQWKPGPQDAVSQGNNGDAGFYVFLVAPGIRLQAGGAHKGGGNRILRMKAKRSDIVWGGRDQWNNHSGTCLVMRHLELSEGDHADAMDDQQHGIKVVALTKLAKRTIKKSKGRKKAQRKKTKATVKKVKKRAKATRKATKVVAKKKAATKAVKTRVTLKAAKERAAAKRKKTIATKKRLMKLTVVELRVQARKKKVPAFKSMNKTQLIDALK